MESFAYIPILFAIAACIGMALSVVVVRRLKRARTITVARGAPKEGVDFDGVWWQEAPQPIARVVGDGARHGR